MYKFGIYKYLQMLDSHKRFADKYFETLNASKSAIYAGFSEATSRQGAYQLLQKEDIQEYLERLRAEAAEKSGISREWIIERFKEVSDRCIQAEPVMDKNGMETGEYKFDSAGVNKATEMLGKIIGIFEKDNNQSKAKITNVVNLGAGTAPDDTSAETE